MQSNKKGLGAALIGAIMALAAIISPTQALDTDWLFTSAVSDVRGDGQSARVDIISAGGVPITENGVIAYTASPLNAVSDPLAGGIAARA